MIRFVHEEIKDRIKEQILNDQEIIMTKIAIIQDQMMKDAEKKEVQDDLVMAVARDQEVIQMKEQEEHIQEKEVLHVKKNQHQVKGIEIHVIKGQTDVTDVVVHEADQTADREEIQDIHEADHGADPGADHLADHEGKQDIHEADQDPEVLQEKDHQVDHDIDPDVIVQEEDIIVMTMDMIQNMNIDEVIEIEDMIAINIHIDINIQNHIFPCFQLLVPQISKVCKKV